MSRFFLPFLFVGLTVLLSACSQEPVTNYDLIISNVGFFDGHEDHGRVNLAFQNDSLVLISEDLPDTPARDTIFGDGHYVIPGLINGHVHLSSRDSLKSALSHGVMAVLDMHKTSEDTARVLRTFRDSLNYAKFYSSGWALTAPGGHPTQYAPDMEVISDSSDIERVVQNRIDHGADYIKIVYEPGDGSVPHLSMSEIEEIIDVARNKNRKTIVHTGNIEAMIQIAAFGADGFAHMWIDANQVATEEQLDTLKQMGIFVMPQIILDIKGYEDQQSWIDQIGFYPFADPETTKKELLKIYNAGIPIIGSTDSPNSGVNAGPDLIHELELHQEAGIPAIDVLRSATGVPADYFETGGIGTIENNSKPSFLLIQGDPTENISAVKNIKGIWKDGKPVK